MNFPLVMNRRFRLGVVDDRSPGAVPQCDTGSQTVEMEPREAVARGAQAPSASARRFSEWLRPQQIVLDVDVPDGRRALELAAAQIGHAHGLDPSPIFRALWRREQVGSTALGLGVAIPHARIDGIARPLTLFMRTRLAVAFGAPDGKPVSNFLVIMVPAAGDTEDHLQLLAAVAETFSDRAFRACLAASTTALEVDKAFADRADHPA